MSTSTSQPANPSAPAVADDLGWISAYLTIHWTSTPSYRYEFLLWLSFAFVFVVFAILHVLRLQGGVLGAYWSKFALRRRTWRKKSSLKRGHKQPLALPSNAQILTLISLFVVSIILCVVGPDYINPNLSTWNFATSAASTDTNSKRDASVDLTPYIPTYTIPKAFWTAAGRTGNIAFALLPLCVFFALKAPPFAIFALPYIMSIHFDKLVRLHKWCGRLIWLITAAHVALWSVQLAKDTRASTGKPAYAYAFLYDKFIYAWVAFALLTLLTILSLRPIRARFYPFFYGAHIILVPLMLIAAVLHHPPVAWWIYVAGACWVGERAWRATWYIWVNGIGGGYGNPQKLNKLMIESQGKALNDRVNVGLGLSLPSKNGIPSADWSGGNFNHVTPITASSAQSFETPSPMSVNTPQVSRHLLAPPTPQLFTYPPPHSHSSSHRSRSIPPVGLSHVDILPGHSLRLTVHTARPLPASRYAPGQHFLIRIPALGGMMGMMSNPFTAVEVWDTDEEGGNDGTIVVFIIRAKKGWTRDLWDLALAKQEEMIGSGLGGVNSGQPGSVTIRAHLDGPFGSSVRARWQDFSSVLIITGGSGISFGVSVLRHLCDELVKAGRSGSGRHRVLGFSPGQLEMGVVHAPSTGWMIRRIRFVWLVREYAHMQWCASAIRQCMMLVPDPSVLEVNVFVTNFKPQLPPQLGSSSSIPVDAPLPAQSEAAKRLSKRLSHAEGTLISPIAASPMPTLDVTAMNDNVIANDEDILVPPVPQFAKESMKRTSVRSNISRGGHARSGSSSSLESGESNDSLVDLSYYFHPGSEDEGGEERDPDIRRHTGVGPRTSVTEVSKTFRAERGLSTFGSRMFKGVSIFAGSITGLGASSSSSGNQGGNTEPDHEEHILDYTNFDGEDDTVLPGEAQLSQKVKTEGRKRRAKSMRVSRVLDAKRVLEERMGEKQRDKTRESRRVSVASIGSTDHLLTPGMSISSPPLSPLSEGDSDWDEHTIVHSPIRGRDEEHVDYGLKAQARASSSHVGNPRHERGPSNDHPPSGSANRRLLSALAISAQAASSSSATLPPPSPASTLAPSSFSHHNEDTRSTMTLSPTVESSENPFSQRDSHRDSQTWLHIDKAEARDLRYISETARPGKPKLDRLLADEVERSSGAVAVACCGPTSLNALMRKTIAAQIDPQRILKGDMRGSITFVSEDFEF